jgi:single-stranded DNA-binding protein
MSISRKGAVMSASAPNLNNVTLVGQLTADPEHRDLPDGGGVWDLRLGLKETLLNEETA